MVILSYILNMLLFINKKILFLLLFHGAKNTILEEKIRFLELENTIFNVLGLAGMPL